MMTPDFEMLGSLPLAIVATGLVLVGAYAVGQMAVGRAGRGVVGRSDVVVRIAAGLVVIAWLVVVLGSCRWLGGWRRTLLLGAIGGGGLLLVGAVTWRHLARRRELNLKRGVPPLAVPRSPERKGRRVSRKTGGDARQRVVHRPTSWGRAWLARAVAVVGLVTLGPGLCYPTGWDELVYHHELPRRWQAEGWPAVYLDLPYSGFPSAAEVLFWLMTPLEGVIAPRLLMWCCWALGLAGVFWLLRRRLAVYGAAALTAAFGLSGTLLMISANCYVESLLLLLTVALLLAVERFPRRGDWRAAAAIGVLSGGAAAVKLTGVAVGLLPLAWFALQVWGGRMRLRNAAAAAGVYAVVAAAVAAPFYVRPWVATGNPFYPYYAAWFTSDAATLEMSRFHQALGAAFGVHTSAAFFMTPILQASELNSEVNVYDGSFGWQLVVLLFLGVVALLRAGGPRRRLLVVWPAGMAFGLYVFWFFTAQQARFAIPAVLGLTLLAASGLKRIESSWRSAVIAVLVLATVVSLPYRTAGHYFGSWLTAVGVVSRADYVALSTGGSDPSDRFYLPMIRAIAEHTPSEARLMVLFEHRGFYLPRKHEIGTPLFQAANFMPPEEFSDAESVLAHLKERRITHVLYPTARAGPDQVESEFERQAGILPLFGQLTNQGKLRVVWRSERYFLLEVVGEEAGDRGQEAGGRLAGWWSQDSKYCTEC